MVCCVGLQREPGQLSARLSAHPHHGGLVGGTGGLHTGVSMLRESGRACRARQARGGRPATFVRRLQQPDTSEVKSEKF